MPGHPLGIDLPTLLDSPDTQAAKTITALQTIVADLEGLVSVVGLLADGPLNMGGQSILATGGIVLTDAVPSGAPTGSLYRSGSSLYYVDSLGAVRITNGATLNLSVAGGFTGDLAHLGASYNYANNEYTFADDGGNLAKLKGSALRLKGGAKFLLIQPDPSLAADRTFTVYDPPASGIGLMSLSSAGAIKQPLDEASRVTQDVHLSTVFGPIPVAIPQWKLDGTTGLVSAISVQTSEPDIRHTARKVSSPLSIAHTVGTPPAGGWAFVTTGTQPQWGCATPAGGDTLYFPLVGLMEGDTVDSVAFRANWSNHQYSAQMVYFNDGGLTAVGSNVNFTPLAGVSTQTVNIATAVASLDSRTYYVRLVALATATCTLYNTTYQTSR